MAGRRSSAFQRRTCFRAYERLIVEAPFDRSPERLRILTREDLRSAAFCVAYEDERRRLQGLCPVPQSPTCLAQAVRQAERLYRAALVSYESQQIVSECRQERLLRHGLIPALPKPGSSQAWRRSADLLTLTLMRFNLATGGQGDWLRNVLR